MVCANNACAWPRTGGQLGHDKGFVPEMIALEGVPGASAGFAVTAKAVEEYRPGHHREVD